MSGSSRPSFIVYGILIISFLLCVIVLYVYEKRRFDYWKKRGVTVSIEPIPIFGNFKDVCLCRTSPAEFLRNLYEKGRGRKYIGFYVLDKPFLLLRDPEIIKEVLVKKFDKFCDRYADTSRQDTIGISSLFLQKYPDWKIARGDLTPVFTMGKLKHMFQQLASIEADLETHLESLGITEEESKLVEFKEIFTKYSTDAMATCMFGLRANCLRDPKAEFRKYGKRIFHFTYKRALEFTAIFFAPYLVKPFGCKFFEGEASIFMRNVLWETVIARQKSGKKRNDAIDAIVERMKINFSNDSRIDENNNNDDDDDDDERKLDSFQRKIDELLGPSIGAYAGAFEESSALMTFTLYELALHPDIQKRLRREIDSAPKDIDGNIRDYDVVTSLTYLEMIVSESLRKYPPLPLLDRLTVTEHKFTDSDLIIEKGIPIAISLYALHHDPDYFTDPDKFDPERFNSENKTKIPPYVYMPFSRGPRSCLGTRLAVLHSKLGLIKIISRYEILPSELTSVPIRFDPKALVATPFGGLNLRVRRIPRTIDEPRDH